MELNHGKTHLMDANKFRSYMFQGRALFTLENVEKKTYITMKVKSKKVKRDQPEETRFFDVYVRAIGDSFAGSLEIGEIDRCKSTFKKKAGINPEHVGIKTVKWLIDHWKNFEEFDKKIINFL